MAKKDSLTEELKKHFGFDTFKGNQKAIIENVLSGNDTFVLMPTGGGKSLCYQLPSLLMEGTAIVISPLIALMTYQADAIRYFSEEERNKQEEKIEYSSTYVEVLRIFKEALSYVDIMKIIKIL